MFIVIDSNHFFGKPDLTLLPVSGLFEGMEQVDAQLVMPEVVFEEVVNNYRKFLENAINKYEQSRCDLMSLTGKQITPAFAKIEIPREVEECRKRLRDQLKAHDARFVDYPSVSHQELITRALSRRRPFKETGKGYRDSLVWESVLTLASQENQTVVLISGNHKDFAESSDVNSGLHPDLVQELNKRGIDVEKVQYFQRPEDFLNAYLESLPPLRDQINAETFVGLNIIQWTKDHLLKLLNEQLPKVPHPSIPSRFYNTIFQDIEQLTKVEAAGVSRLSASKLLIFLHIVARVSVWFTTIAYYEGLLDDYEGNRGVPYEVDVLFNMVFDERNRKIVSVGLDAYKYQQL